MFVANAADRKKGSQHQQDQIITRAMGVRVPPQRRPKVEKNPRRLCPLRPSRPFEASHSARFPDLSLGIKAQMRRDKRLESIKITAPGTYELNLPSLFERDELIMAVKEGTYFIDLSSAFRKKKD